MIAGELARMRTLGHNIAVIHGFLLNMYFVPSESVCTMPADPILVLLNKLPALSRIVTTSTLPPLSQLYT